MKPPTLDQPLEGPALGLRKKFTVSSGLKKTTVRIRKPSVYTHSGVDHAAESAAVGQEIQKPTEGMY